MWLIYHNIISLSIFWHLNCFLPDSYIYFKFNGYWSEQDMKSLKSIIVLLFCILATPTYLSSQPYSDTVTVKLDLFIPSNGVIFLNDLDLTNLDAAPILFGITITNYFSVPIEIIMRIGVIRDGHTLIEGTTYSFSVLPGVTYLNNRDLENKYPLSQSHIDLGELENIVYSTGKLPLGEYIFFVEVEYQDKNIAAYDEKTLSITDSPTVLDLLSPGQPAETGNVMEIYTTAPFFLWHSNASKFRITICEKLPTNTSPADVMYNEPWMQDNFDNLTFFPYPSSEVRPLLPGKTYYWQIVAITESSDGPIELESEIWGFKISNLSDGIFAMEHQQILAYLTLFFGGKGLADLFEPGGELHGFTFTGAMYNNGAPMTMEDLNVIIEKIINKHITIDNYYVE